MRLITAVALYALYSWLASGHTDWSVTGAIQLAIFWGFALDLFDVLSVISARLHAKAKNQEDR